MKTNEWISIKLGEHDSGLAQFLKEFNEKNKDIEPAQFAEKLKNDPLFNIFIMNANLSQIKYIKKMSMWINFWSVLLIISFFITICVAILTFAK